MVQKLNIPLDKIESYKSAFDLIDFDKSGTIGADEIFEFFRDIGNEISYEEVMDIIRKIDYDGSGTLDFEEFISVMEKINMDHEIEEDEVYKAFMKFDKKKKGFISAIELKSIVKNIAGGITDDEIEDFLKEVGFNLSDIIDYKKILIKYKEELDILQ